MPPIEPAPSRYLFPDPRRGVGPHGVVCIGGDFAPGTLLSAYRRGIFPWPVSPDLVPWCSPDPRALFPLGDPPGWSRSLRRAMRKKPFRITLDAAFADVMTACGERDEGTWITRELTAGFLELHRLGWAHSLEVWSTETDCLVGGIYGLALGGMFAGESMFHRETDASKVAFASLADRLRDAGFVLFDTQQMTPHLASLGCIGMPRERFLSALPDALQKRCVFPRA